MKQQLQFSFQSKTWIFRWRCILKRSTANCSATARGSAWWASCKPPPRTFPSPISPSPNWDPFRWISRWESINNLAEYFSAFRGNLCRGRRSSTCSTTCSGSPWPASPSSLRRCSTSSSNSPRAPWPRTKGIRWSRWVRFCSVWAPWASPKILIDWAPGTNSVHL